MWIQTTRRDTDLTTQLLRKTLEIPNWFPDKRADTMWLPVSIHCNYRPQGKVMFSEASVCPWVGVCLQRGSASGGSASCGGGGPASRGSAFSGIGLQEGLPDPLVVTSSGGHCRNAFLFIDLYIYWFKARTFLKPMQFALVAIHTFFCGKATWACSDYPLRFIYTERKRT